MTAKDLANHTGFASSQNAVIDKDTGKLRPDRFVEQRGGYARIHPATQSKDHSFFPDLGPEILDRLFDVISHRPVLAAPANFMNKIGNDLFAARCMRHFGVELKPEEFSRSVFNGSIF